MSIDIDAVAQDICTGLKGVADELATIYVVAQQAHTQAGKSEDLAQRMAMHAIFGAVEDVTSDVTHRISHLNNVINTLVQTTKTDAEETNDNTD